MPIFTACCIRNNLGLNDIDNSSFQMWITVIIKKTWMPMSNLKGIGYVITAR